MMHPNFQQTAPREAGWVRQPTHPKDAMYRFVHEETGKEIICPKMWYNGTVEDRLKTLYFSVESILQRNIYWQKELDRNPKYYDAKYHLESNARQLFNLNDLIDRIKLNGNVLEPFRDAYNEKTDREVEAYLATQDAA